MQSVYISAMKYYQKNEYRRASKLKQKGDIITFGFQHSENKHFHCVICTFIAGCETPLYRRSKVSQIRIYKIYYKIIST